ncbi:hypothetical protein F4804DRAFT_87012 [Jackrogersella minutella]|nr:hypothetical protein F4804DRAFT_87012 [Jackrogersella minutella]
METKHGLNIIQSRPANETKSMISQQNDTTRRSSKVISEYGPTSSNIEYSSPTPFEVRALVWINDHTRDKGKGFARHVGSQSGFTDADAFDRVLVGYDETIITLVDICTTPESTAILANEETPSLDEEQFRDTFLRFRYVLSPTYDGMIRAESQFAPSFASDRIIGATYLILRWMATEGDEC